jgi:ABC-2 type transport system ATP-binding protein
VIDVRELGRTFGKPAAVNSVSFGMALGEVFGFVGPNGAGKTTTINMLCTLLRPSLGTAAVNGFDIVGKRSQIRRSSGLALSRSAFELSRALNQRR